LRIAIDLVREGVIDEGEALERLEGIDFSQLAVTRFADPAEAVARGVGASGGVAVGRAAFDSASAERFASCGDPVVLVRPDMSTDDVAGLAVSAGIVTAVGGRTAHAALVARQKGKPCVVACERLSVDAPAHRASLAGASIEEGDWLSVDGDAGSIFLGRHAILNEKPERELAEVNAWRERVASHTGSSTEILVPGPH
jgi:pyruvate,orthophosphate dikinase